MYWYGWTRGVMDAVPVLDFVGKDRLLALCLSHEEPR